MVAASMATMLDLRPVGNLIGLLIAAFGISMLLPAGLAALTDQRQMSEFVLAAFLTTVVGGALNIVTHGTTRGGLNLQQVFLMTTLVWVVLPIFGALPFFLGEGDNTYTDAFFEAMSGLTTTGATVFSNLQDQPKGVLLWRGMLQWFGGVGIVVVAMGLLPALRIGGMQIFRTEAFDTMGKVLPRAAELSVNISLIYVLLTAACALSYGLAGLDLFDAVVHALTTVSTGGFSNYDASFGAMKGAPEYVSVAFMLAAAIPFVRLVQLGAGSAGPLVSDAQIRAMVRVLLAVVVAMLILRVSAGAQTLEPAFREVLFNVTSIMTGTGYASTDYQLWGAVAVSTFFAIGLIGGCAGSTTCSIKIFRYQILISAVRTQTRRLYSPNGVFSARYDGRAIDQEVFSSVMAFFVMFFASLLFFAVAMALTGEDMVTSISGAAAALANIGPGLGDKIGPAGTYAEISTTGKWVLCTAMVVGRLELLSVFVLFSANFWRR